MEGSASTSASSSSSAPTASQRRPPPDVSLVISGRRIPANRDVLARQSEYFRGMFHSDFKEKYMKEVNLKDVPAPPDVAEKVIAFAENVDVVAEESKKENVQLEGLDDASDLVLALHFADMVGIRCAVQAICVKMISILQSRPSTAVEIFCGTEPLSATGERSTWCVHEAAAKTALFNVSPHWDQMPDDVLRAAKLHHMETLLSRSDLNVESELEVFRLMKRWVELQPSITGFTRLLKCIRIRQATNVELKAMLSDKLVSETSSAARNMIKEVLDYREGKLKPNAPLPDLMASPSAADGGPIRCLPVFPCIYATFQGHMSILKYDGRTNSLTELASSVYNRGALGCDDASVVKRLPQCGATSHSDQGEAKGFRACSSGTEIFVTGGERSLGRGEWLKKVWAFSTATGKWRVVGGGKDEINAIHRRHHAVVLVGNKLFMCGGFGVHRIPLETVDVVDTLNGSVQGVKPLPMPLQGYGCCVFKGRPYVISDAIYVYKADEDAWIRMGRLSLKDVGQAVADENFIYISIKRTYDLYKFRPDELIVEQDVEPTLLGRFQSEAQSFCLVNGVIYNFSTDQFDSISTIETYNIGSHRFASPWTNRGRTYDFNIHHVVGSFPLVVYPVLRPQDDK